MLMVSLSHALDRAAAARAAPAVEVVMLADVVAEFTDQVDVRSTVCATGS
jgi:tRNA C32,U32 (ribose-2'-O)-methylase TrmJ